MNFSWVIPIIEKVLGYGIIGAVGVLVFALLVTEFLMFFAVLIVTLGADHGKDENNNGRIGNDKEQDQGFDR